MSVMQLQGHDLSSEQLATLLNVLPVFATEQGDAFLPLHYANGDAGWKIEWFKWSNVEQDWMSVDSDDVPDDVRCTHDPY